MRGNERLHQVNQRLQRLYSENSTLFRRATEPVTDGLWEEVGVGFAESGVKPLTPEDMMNLFLSRLKELDTDTHDTLQRNLADLAAPIGKLCSLRLLDEVDDTKVSYSYVEDVTVTASGLLPHARVMQVTGVEIMYPALEIVGPYLDPTEVPFMVTSQSPDDLGRRCTVSWTNVRAIEVHN